MSVPTFLKDLYKDESFHLECGTCKRKLFYQLLDSNGNCIGCGSSSLMRVLFPPGPNTFPRTTKNLKARRKRDRK